VVEREGLLDTIDSFDALPAVLWSETPSSILCLKMRSIVLAAVTGDDDLFERLKVPPKEFSTAPAEVAVPEPDLV